MLCWFLKDSSSLSNLGHANIPWIKETDRDATGWNHPQTFSADKQGVRWIDHILTMGQLHVTNYRAEITNLSAHEAFYVDVRLPKELKNHLPTPNTTLVCN